MALGVNFGFDSCSAPAFLDAIKDLPDYAKLADCAEPCESTLFSLYVDCAGRAWPCSFCEGTEGQESVDLLNLPENPKGDKIGNIFSEQIWANPILEKFREKLLSSEKCGACRKCPVFNLSME
jgi:hypothetical protein